jgi:hypothetical protein
MLRRERSTEDLIELAYAGSGFEPLERQVRGCRVAYTEDTGYPNRIRGTQPVEAMGLISEHALGRLRVRLHEYLSTVVQTDFVGIVDVTPADRARGPNDRAEIAANRIAEARIHERCCSRRCSRKPRDEASQISRTLSNPSAPP